MILRYLLVPALLISGALSACNCNKASLCKDVVCSAGDVCHSAGSCDPLTGHCSNPARADGTSCADVNQCNGNEVCTAGSCGVAPGTVVTCSSPPVCHLAAGATCDPASGSCSYSNAPDRSSCTFSGTCDGVSGCQTGLCACLHATLRLRVLAPGGVPISGVQVTWGASQVTTDASGIAALQGVPGQRAVLQLRAAGYAASALVLEAPPAAAFDAIAWLLPRADALSFDATRELRAHGPTYYFPEPALNPNGRDAVLRDAILDLPAGALVDSADAGVAQAVLTITSLDPTGPRRAAAPGEFIGAQADGGASVPVEGLAMAEVLFTAADGGTLQLATGQSMTLHLRLPPALQGSFDGGEELPAWSFDGDAGVWLQDPSATGALVVSRNFDGVTDGSPAEGVLEWRAQLSHAGWWAVLRPLPDRSCVKVTVMTTAGSLVANAAVHAQGNQAQTLGRTGPGGEPACLDFAQGKQVSIALDDPLLASGTAVSVTGSGAGTCGGSACQTATLTVSGTTCIHGAVVNDADAGVDGAAVTAIVGRGFAARAVRATTAGGGAYCLEVPTSDSVRLFAKSGSGTLARGVVTTATAIGACGGTCNEAQNLVLAPDPGTLCVTGRIYDADGGFPLSDGGYQGRVPAVGAPVFVYDQGDGGVVTPSCPSGVDGGSPADGGSPSDWATAPAALIASGVTGADGRFCVEFAPPAAPAPSTPQQHTYVAVPGDCALRRRGIADEFARGYCGVDALTPDPVDTQRMCEIENCIDLGDFDYSFLYDSSGCHR